VARGALRPDLSGVDRLDIAVDGCTVPLTAVVDDLRTLMARRAGILREVRLAHAKRQVERFGSDPRREVFGVAECARDDVKRSAVGPDAPLYRFDGDGQ
jgi:hypothetical protein